MRLSVLRSLTSGVRTPNYLWIGMSLVCVLAIAAALAMQHAAAVAPSNEHFERTWARPDRPVRDGEVARTWIYGPEAFTGSIMEPYAQSPGGEREVQYYDKSRMEINDPDAEVVYPWYVTNGLLVVEMMTGRMQVGDASFVDRFVAEIPVAGDLNDPDGVTYATLADLLDEPPVADGAVYQTRLFRDGTTQVDASLATHGVVADYLDDVTNHRIAGPFWDFMNSDGLVEEDGQLIIDDLFENPFYATGRPITEAYWVTSRVAGTPRDVLVQCFERRCLTYTPGNPEGFIVEAGNVGLHYYTWRYEQSVEPTATPTEEPGETPTPTSTATPTQTPTPTSTPTVPVTPTEIPMSQIEILAEVDCDSDGVVDGAATEEGSFGPCGPFTAGDIVTEQQGSEDEIDEVQQLGANNATDGFVRLTFIHPEEGLIVVNNIEHDASAAEVQLLFDAEFASEGVGADSPTVSGGPLDTFRLRFTFENGDLAGTDVPLMDVDHFLDLPPVNPQPGQMSTVIDGQPASPEIQVLTPNDASAGAFRLRFDHPFEGTITTEPIAYDASAVEVEFALAQAFGDIGAFSDTPTVSGGPADFQPINLTFENGDLAGENVPEFTVLGGGLETRVEISRVDVRNASGDLIESWDVDEDGFATGDVPRGDIYEFRFVYQEDTGEGDVDTTGFVEIVGVSRDFTLVVELDYDGGIPVVE